MANSTTPVATSSASTVPLPSTHSAKPKPKLSNSNPYPHAHCQWSPLPSEIEDHFSRMEQHLHGLAITLYRLQKLCPLVKSTPDLRALTTKVESLGGMMKEAVKEMHDKMSIPFKVTQPAFQDEELRKSQVELRPSVQVPESGTTTESGRLTPDADTTTMTLAATTTTASTRFRGDIPRVPRVVKRHGPGDLAKTLPYSLQVRDVPGSPFSSWHIPYTVVFTPDEKTVDVDGNPLPAILVDVDENGGVKYVWKNGTLDKATEKVAYVDEAPCVLEAKPDLRSKTIRRVTLVPPQRIPQRTAGNAGDNLAAYLTSADIYAMGGRIMRDFMQVTQAQAEAAAGRKRKREDGQEVDSPGPGTMKRQRPNIC